MRRSPRKTLLFFSAILILTLLAGCSFGTGGMKKTDGDVSSVKDRENWDIAETSPLGKYPELVTYTLGQMKGANNSNLPDGQNYEDNAYTRYLKKTLNIQNKNVFMESEDPFLGMDSSKWKYLDFTGYTGYFYPFSGAYLPFAHACYLLIHVLTALSRVITRYSVRG